MSPSRMFAFGPNDDHAQSEEDQENQHRRNDPSEPPEQQGHHLCRFYGRGCRKPGQMETPFGRLFLGLTQPIQGMVTTNRLPGESSTCD